MPEQEPQLWFNGELVLLHTPKKQKCLITDIASWMEAFSIFYLICCSSFPHRWRDLTSCKRLILRPSEIDILAVMHYPEINIQTFFKANIGVFELIRCMT